MRYTIPVAVLVSDVAVAVIGVWLLVVAVGNGPGTPATLLATALCLGAFVTAAWAVGRIRRIRSLTPEAIIGPLEDPGASDHEAGASDR
jgi:hypothetical protein